MFTSSNLVRITFIVALVRTAAFSPIEYISPQIYEYDPEMAYLMAMFTGAAYCCGLLGEGCITWDCPVCLQLPLNKVSVIMNSTTDANGFVGYNVWNNTIIVTFSGTNPANPNDWITDVNTIMVSYPACPGCMVHKGFFLAYQSVKQQVRDAVQGYLKQHPRAKVLVTGHSLGAALATHCALDLMSMGITAEPMYTMGQPRLGNQLFAQYVDVKAPVQWRIVHARDPVPHLPANQWGFWHVATEVFYPDDGSNFTLCDTTGEDPTCSDQFLFNQTVMSDHYLYVDFNYTLSAEQCNGTSSTSPFYPTSAPALFRK